MSDPEYAPFPAGELEYLAEYFDYLASRGGSAYAKGIGWDRAAVCRNAIASYKALNERCLRAELALNHGIKEPAS